MEQWGPYVTERDWGTAMTPRAGARTYEEACSSDKCVDGIFGFGNASGTLKASFAFWNGQDSHLKERLFDDREIYTHDLADPQYRYCSCRYVYPQAAFPYENQSASLLPDRAFDLQFELAKEPPADCLFYRLTVTNRTSETQPSELTVATHLWACHVDCGRIEQVRGANSLKVSAADTCNGPKSTRPRFAGAYRLHYQADGLHRVAFGDASSPGAFNRLIVHQDSSLLRSDECGSRASIVYKLSVPANASVSLCFQLVSEGGGNPPPDWAAVPALMQRSAQQASDFLAAALPAQLPEAAKQIARRAYASILWNRQLCHVGAPYLIVVPDKWHRPRMASWEHALHAIVLCGVSHGLATAELRNQLAAQLMISGELAFVKAAPPVWPLALLELIPMQVDKEVLERIFLDMLRHLNWLVLERKDEKGRNTIDGGILGLEHRGWIASTHASETNDTLVWTGFFCAKMIHVAAQLQRCELKACLDLFNAALSVLRLDVAFVGGQFRPKFAGQKRDCADAGLCCCSFGFVPLLGCAAISWDLLTDKDSRVLIEWLHWLSNEVVTTEMPALFVKTDTNSNKFLISWITETEFVKVCATLFDPAHFLCPYGIQCTSQRLSDQLADQSDASSCRPDGAALVSIPLNYLTLEALKCWESVYGSLIHLEYPTGSGVRVTLNEIILDISRRLLSIFRKIADDAPMFYEFYRAADGKGTGPSHTSWSSLIANICQNLTRQPTPTQHKAPQMPKVVARILPKNSLVRGFRRVLRSSIKLEDFAPDASFDWTSAEED